MTKKCYNGFKTLIYFIYHFINLVRLVNPALILLEISMHYYDDPYLINITLSSNDILIWFAQNTLSIQLRTYYLNY